MRRLALALLLLAVAAPGASATVAPTTFVRWSPFDADGRLRLPEHRQAPGTCEAPFSEGVVSLAGASAAYRCFSGHWVEDPCWQDGTRDRVVCPRGPWARSADVFEVPHFAFANGVTFAAPVDPQSDPAWWIVLADGRRCFREEGAHDSAPLPDGRLSPVDYGCPGGIYVLRAMTRGRVWHVHRVRWTGSRYAQLGLASVRTAAYGAIPPQAVRRNGAARAAALASGIPIGHVLLVRITQPALDWALVRGVTRWRLLRHTAAGWRVVHRGLPSCRLRLPKQVRTQLLGCNLPAKLRRGLD